MFIQDLVDIGLSKEMAVFVISMLPVVELRGALPVAINVFDIPWYWAFALAFAGNLLPVPFILLFLEKITRWLRRWQTFERFFKWLFKRTRSRSRLALRYKRAGLILLVAIPLPVTGAWTGSLVAVLFGLERWPSFFSITVGVFIAGVIVTALSLLGWLGAFIAGLLLIAIAVSGLWRTPLEPESQT